MLSVMLFLGILTMSQLAGADESRDDGSTMIASAKSTNTLGKKPASEISKEAAEKKQSQRDKQKAANRRLIKMKKYHGGLGLNPVEEGLLMQLPWEVRKQLKDIPQNRRTNWMIERLVERKAPMIAKRLCRNKKFKEKYDNASQEEKPEILERGLKYHIQSNMKKSKRGDVRGFEQRRKEYEYHKKMAPEQRKKFSMASPDRKRDFMADKAMKHKGDEVRKVIVKNPELREKLEKMSPEDRKATIEKLLKQKMAGYAKGMKERGDSQRFRHDERSMMRDRGEMSRMRLGRERMNRDEHHPKMEHPKMEHPRMKHPRMMDRHGMGYDRGMKEHSPMMREHYGMRDRDGMKKHDQFMRRDFEREMPRMMLHFMRENPERVRDFIRNLPPEVKRELRNLLDEEPRKFNKKDKKNKKGKKGGKDKKDKKKRRK